MLSEIVDCVSSALNPVYLLTHAFWDVFRCELLIGLKRWSRKSMRFLT